MANRKKNSGPFKIPKNMPPPLTFEELVKKYKLTKKDVKEIREFCQLVVDVLKEDWALTEKLKKISDKHQDLKRKKR